jgi:DNA-binding winged helix-turn-helix (wHTH) protein
VICSIAMRKDQHTTPATIDLAREPDFTIGSASVRPSACEVLVDGVARRVEPRAMQVLVALAAANGAVISRDELMARCWTGLSISEDAVTRAVGQVRRVAPSVFSVETIPKVGYRLLRETAVEQPARRASPKAIPLLAAMALILIAVAVVIVLPGGPAVSTDTGTTAGFGTQSLDARDRYLRATALLDAGGKDNTLRAEQLLREALALDENFHSARETLAVALLSVAAFVPERAAEANAESAALTSAEVSETPAEWRAHLIRGFELAQQGDWLAVEQALAEARRLAPAEEQSAGNGLQVFLHGNVGRYSDSLDLVKQQAQSQPISRDTSRVLQQWLDRAGEHVAAEAEYERSRDLPGDRSSMEMAALVRTLATNDAQLIEERLSGYRETDWGRGGDDALYIVRGDREAALQLLREQIDGYQDPGAMPPFLAAAWAAHYGDAELAVKGLRATPRSLFQTAGMLWDPVFAEVRRSPAFKQLLRDFGYVEYWRITGEWGDFCRPLGADDFECR